LRCCLSLRWGRHKQRRRQGGGAHQHCKTLHTAFALLLAWPPLSTAAVHVNRNSCDLRR
jgi:hypothetical protein